MRKRKGERKRKRERKRERKSKKERKCEKQRGETVSQSTTYSPLGSGSQGSAGFKLHLNHRYDRASKSSTHQEISTRNCSSMIPVLE